MKYKGNKKKEVKITYPSTCGSHKSMINAEYTAFNDGDHEFIVCKDDRGSYITLKKDLDSGLMDFNRTVDVESRTERFKKFLR